MAGWVSFENNIGTSAKALALSDDHYLAAMGLLHLLVEWCDANLTDGMVPRKAMVAVTLGLPCAEALDELVSVGWLHEVKGGWRVHDYTDWQRSAAEIRAKSNASRKAALSRWSNAERNAVGNAERNAERITERNAERNAPTDSTDRQTEKCFSREESPPNLGNFPECFAEEIERRGVTNSFRGHLLRDLEKYAGTWPSVPKNQGKLGSAITDGCTEGCDGSCVRRCASALLKHARTLNEEFAAKGEPFPVELFLYKCREGAR